MYIAYAIYASTALLLRFLAYENPDSSSGSASLFPFLGAIIKLLKCIWMATVPVRYMLYPPTAPDREELMEMDEAKVRRPKKREVNAEGDDKSWPWTEVGEICFICWYYWR